MTRQTVIVALPPDESAPVRHELAEAGFEAIAVTSSEQLDAVLASRREVGVAILDGERDFDTSLELYSLLHEDGRSIPALMIVSARALERLESNATGTSIEDEYFTRPYSADALRWRVEAMLIRSQTVDDGSGPVLAADGPLDPAAFTRKAPIIAIFNPKGGVGKTTIALNLAATLQVRRGQRVLLVDADTVTGHVATSLGLEGVLTVSDAWGEDAAENVPLRSLTEFATSHQNGLTVTTLTSSPLHTEHLDPKQVIDAIEAVRRAFDFIVVDMHPSYSPLNQAIFTRADRILVPITPDVPALRAGLQLRDIAMELGLREKLSMIVNRANSGVSVADMERTVGLSAMALIRSGGLLFVHAANAGRTVVEQYPHERVTADFDGLAEALIGRRAANAPAAAPAAKSVFGNLFRRAKQPVRV